MCTTQDMMHLFIQTNPHSLLAPFMRDCEARCGVTGSRVPCWYVYIIEEYSISKWTESTGSSMIEVLK
ncbi:hypothetical protein M8J76_000850 [Diaphorina citri]|nr:hypothetical protein M8J76_000850 [Diaphorina citri]